MDTNISINQPEATKPYISFNPLEIHYKNYDFDNYCKLIERYSSKVYPKGTYTEEHHPFCQAWIKKLFKKGSEEYKWLMKCKIKLSAHDHADVHIELYMTEEPSQVYACSQMMDEILDEESNFKLSKNLTIGEREHLAERWARNRELEAQSHSQLMKECHSSEEYRQKASENTIKVWKDEDYRKNHAVSSRAYYDNRSPERIKEDSERQKEIQNRPEVRAKKSEKTKETMGTPETKERMRQQTLVLRQDPVYLQHYKEGRDKIDWDELMHRPERLEKVAESNHQSWTDGVRRQKYNEEVAKRDETFILIDPENNVLRIDDLYMYCLNKYGEKGKDARNLFKRNQYYKGWCCLKIKKSDIIADEEAVKFAEERRIKFKKPKAIKEIVYKWKVTMPNDSEIKVVSLNKFIKERFPSKNPQSICSIIRYRGNMRA